MARREKLVRVKDLKEHTGIDERGFVVNNPILYCPVCGQEYSANKGDYWDAGPETVLTCECGENMQLVLKQTRFVAC